ncbi:hypothetical protein [Romboutsia sp. 1001285H_161024_C4]|uniref:hypothetical protein n=1 Tax=Romboutsia sp. 1001285H_161024_C4 TaxID=2787109 RepID=UPI00189BD735|nr:hypothetical protein [Romboutsia sp. 1001285H_161024_C4]
MKKFLLICIIAFVLIYNLISSIATNQLVGQNDTYFTKVKEKEIYIAKNGKWEKLDIVGVNLNSAKPGTFPSDNLVSEDDYLRWISNIYNMGANCIKVSNLMSHNFYNALDKFNKNRESPIYLMQGIYFDEKYLKDGENPQSSNLNDGFITNIKLIVDSVHGNPYNYNKPDIVQFYNTDVSDYVIGYTLGIEFAKHDIIYNEIMNEKEKYNGKYLYTNDKASSFESYMASMGDYLLDYELESYKKQSLISYIGSSSYNIVSGQKNPVKNTFIEKDDRIENQNYYFNPENIKSKSKLKTGLFATYNIYPSYSEVKEYVDKMDYYFKKLNNHHKIPVVIGEYGIPSSRTGGDFNMNSDKIKYIDEKEQGNALVSLYRAIKSSGCAGSFLFEFQDSWSRSSANTAYSKILDRSAYWSDAQTYSQSFGLMAFDPGSGKSVSYVDDSIDEWSEKDIVSKNEDMSLYAKSDEKYLYLMAKVSKDINLSKDDIYIDLDTTPKSGVKKSSQFMLDFEDNVDFIVHINDIDNSAIYVHEYYNRFNFYLNKKDNQKRPDLINHKKDMDVFSPIYIEVRPKMYNTSNGEEEEAIIYETGKLVYGNSNPNSLDYNSASDFYVGKDYVEIRIPWGIINFMDPSTRQIQDDFYEVYKIKPIKIKDIKIGMTLNSEYKKVRLKSESFKLDTWLMPNYHERLKESYYILQKELTKISN